MNDLNDVSMMSPMASNGMERLELIYLVVVVYRNVLFPLAKNTKDDKKERAN